MRKRADRTARVAEARWGNRLNILTLEAVVLFAIACFCIGRRNARLHEPFAWIYYVFFVSGIPALVYQIVWERALFNIYGVNIESVTVVVSTFMLGLGLGSLAGGYLSRIRGLPLLALFGVAEVCSATYGAASLPLIHLVAAHSAGASLGTTALISFGLLLIPTMLMGSTLPLLAEYSVRFSHNVGRSLGMLYFVNTLGSAAACFLAAGVTMPVLGQSGTITLAAALNATVGLSVLAVHFARRQARGADVSLEPSLASSVASEPQAGLLKVPHAAVMVAMAGFIALGYEVLWYRLYSFWSGSNAKTFASLLGAYLAGVAVGGLFAHDLTSRTDRVRNTKQYLRLIGAFVMVANLVGFLVGPALGFAAEHEAPPLVTLLLVVAAALLGSAFPLICHVSVASDSRTGWDLSLLYFSNIAGAALGSFLVGFVLMNWWGAQQLSVFLLTMGVALGFAILLVSAPGRRQLALTAAGAMAIFAAILSLQTPLFAGLYERMLFRNEYHDGIRFQRLVENRAGVIAVTDDDTVFGGGAYDGRFNTDLVHDSNGLFRIFQLSSFHPAPKDVLMIGLASGSWGQVLVNHPQLHSLTVVEINPGYLELISQFPQVASLLKNPKVKIVTDDGRRWLMENPERKFNVIVTNTTFNWREHASNLLSVEYLRLVRRHLKSGGVYFYNTTSSPEVFLTGTTVFPYGMRVGNALALSDTPIEIDTERLRATLLAYKIDDRPVFDLSRAQDAMRFQEMLDMTHRFGTSQDLAHPTVELADSLRARFRGARIITDDNMGTEWSH